MTKSGDVTGQVIRYIREGIKEKKWRVGEKIPSENALCRELSVSRVSVRAALQQYAALGILRSEHGRGTFLISDDLSAFEGPAGAPGAGDLSASAAELEEALVLRGFIEPQICERVAASADEERIAELTARLRGHLSRMQASVGKTMDFVRADADFHMEICRAFGNGIAAETLEGILRKRSEPVYLLSLANGYHGGLYYHERILAAIAARDGRRAGALMEEHLRRGLEDLRASME